MSVQMTISHVREVKESVCNENEIKEHQSKPKERTGAKREPGNIIKYKSKSKWNPGGILPTNLTILSRYQLNTNKMSGSMMWLK